MGARGEPCVCLVQTRAKVKLPYSVRTLDALRVVSSPAEVVRVSGEPWISHRGACASSVDASTMVGDERMCTPSMVAEMTYMPGIGAQ